MATEEEILDFLIILDNLKKAYEADNSEWSGCDLNYTHIGNIIEITSGWSCPEEGGDYNCTIKLEPDNVIVRTVDEASTVHGDYSNDDTEMFESLEVYGKYLIQYFNLADLEQ